MPAPSLFVGNGINQVRGSSYSWGNVLAALAQACGRPDLAKPTSTKPFTLLFEEMVLCGSCEPDRESRLKREVATLVGRIAPFSLHQEVRSLPCAHVLTPNYDYALEHAMAFESVPANVAKETRYSLFRRRQSGQQAVWHIHGEAERPDTIALGHDQYVGCLAKMKGYLSSDRSRVDYSGPRSPLMNGLSDFETAERPYSWVDVFLRDDIYMLGFGLDYTEIDIWWLITLKARLRANSPRVAKGVPVGRTLYFHIHPSRVTGRDRGKLAMLASMGVDHIIIDAGPDYVSAREAYQKAVDYIRQAI